MTKIGWRNFWFQFHKWIGLILAILIIPLCLTGSALVWHDGLDRVLNAQRYAVTGARTLPVATYVATAQKSLPAGEGIASLKMPGEPGDPVVVATGPGASALRGPALRTNVYLDPPTARVLEVAGSRSGPVMILHMIHGTFMIPGVGRAIVGWVGVAMMISAFTGIWLWWPTIGRWTRGLRWRRRPNVDSNLHHLFGFWVAVPLFLLSLTGAWISFPGFFGPLAGENGRPMGFGADRAAMARAKPLPETATSLSTAVAKAQALAPGRLVQINWPTDYKAQWSVIVKPAHGKPVTVAVDDRSGKAMPSPGIDRGQAPVARLMRQIHDGTGMGIAWQVVIFIGGLLPAILAITGIIMWWRARGWRAALADRQRG
ncbi:MAG: PepSY-associated TM helix domain-containing protein [Sphingomonas sp.]